MFLLVCFGFSKHGVPIIFKVIPVLTNSKKQPNLGRSTKHDQRMIVHDAMTIAIVVNNLFVLICFLIFLETF